jgi:hypothetical protein
MKWGPARAWGTPESQNEPPLAPRLTRTHEGNMNAPTPGQAGLDAS